MTLAALCVLDGASARVMSLSSVDRVIIILYFGLVLGLGLYLRRYTTTGKEFFMAGRQMSAWVAGLSFISANLGSLEIFGESSSRD